MPDTYCLCGRCGCAEASHFAHRYFPEISEEGRVIQCLKMSETILISIPVACVVLIIFIMLRSSRQSGHHRLGERTRPSLTRSAGKWWSGQPLSVFPVCGNAPWGFGLLLAEPECDRIIPALPNTVKLSVRAAVWPVVGITAGCKCRHLSKQNRLLDRLFAWMRPAGVSTPVFMTAPASERMLHSSQPKPASVGSLAMVPGRCLSAP